MVLQLLEISPLKKWVPGNSFLSKLIISLTFTCLLFSHSLSGSNGVVHFSSGNDNCLQAFRIRNVSNWCSSPRQFTNESASASNMIGPVCFPSYDLDQDNDVWFVFTAIAPTVNISVIGAIKDNPKGTLSNPQFALYIGSCSAALKEVACISDYRGDNIVETFVDNIIVGANYYIRVDGRNSRKGSFQLCVNNFNPVRSPSSDCSSAVVLCDLSSFTVPSVIGAGKNTNELTSGTCLKDESSSSWYKWTCDKPGSLTFALTPVNPADDIDFALFWLPNGVEDCSFKVPLRCMASGENVNQPYHLWSRCTGPTGLKASAFDIVENEGCDDQNDNFLAPLQMEVGKSYALLINNYHNTGNGFSIEFGGSGSFVGPIAHFTVNKLTLEQGQDLHLKDASKFTGGIKKWNWNFGLDAKPQRAQGRGPHKVNYSTSGKKSISLSVETGNGCTVTKVRTVQIQPTAKVQIPQETFSKEESATSASNPSELDILPGETIEMITELDGSSEEEYSNLSPISEESREPSTDTTRRAVEFSVKYVSSIYFKADSSALEIKDYETLGEVLRLLDEFQNHLVIVEGYTNSIPSDDYCIKLASARADNVIAFLKSKGIAEERIVRKVYGKHRSKTNDNSLRNRRQFQKVELKILDKE